MPYLMQRVLTASYMHKDEVKHTAVGLESATAVSCR